MSSRASASASPTRSGRDAAVDDDESALNNLDESAILEGLCDGESPDPKPLAAMEGSKIAVKARLRASQMNLLASCSSSGSLLDDAASTMTDDTSNSSGSRSSLHSSQPGLHSASLSTGWPEPQLVMLNGGSDSFAVMSHAASVNRPGSGSKQAPLPAIVKLDRVMAALQPSPTTAASSVTTQASVVRDREVPVPARPNAPAAPSRRLPGQTPPPERSAFGSTTSSVPLAQSKAQSKSMAGLAPVRPPSGNIATRAQAAAAATTSTRRASRTQLNTGAALGSGALAQQPQKSSSNRLARGSSQNLLGSSPKLRGSTNNLSSSTGTGGAGGGSRRGSLTSTVAASTSNLRSGPGTRGSRGDLMSLSGGGGTRREAAAAAAAAAVDPTSCILEIDAALHDAERNLRAPVLPASGLPSIDGKAGEAFRRASIVSARPGGTARRQDSLGTVAPISTAYMESMEAEKREKAKNVTSRLTNPDNYTDAFKARMDAINQRKLAMIREQQAAAAADPANGPISAAIPAPVLSSSVPISSKANAVTSRLYQQPASPPAPGRKEPTGSSSPSSMPRPPANPPPSNGRRRPAPPALGRTRPTKSMGGMDLFSAGSTASIEEIRKSDAAAAAAAAVKSGKTAAAAREGGGGGGKKKSESGGLNLVDDLELKDGTLRRVQAVSMGNLMIIK
ncbi:hypothetical protein H9P43_002276 [Blastocladiella emersonii ATCC 22665]|nr:hypothetical protein H9P43_002276 [Blastocladiella emersonii ATCC 22665]